MVGVHFLVVDIEAALPLRTGNMTVGFADHIHHNQVVQSIRSFDKLVFRILV